MKSKKGFGEVASTLIMFIAVIAVTVGVVASFQNFVVDTQDSFKDRQDLTNDKLKTSIAITHVYYNATSQQLFTYIKNIGEISLETQFFDVYLDSDFQTSFSVLEPSNFSQSLELMAVQKTGVVVLNTSLQPGTHKVKVVTNSGVFAQESFNS